MSIAATAWLYFLFLAGATFSIMPHVVTERAL